MIHLVEGTWTTLQEIGTPKNIVTLEYALQFIGLKPLAPITSGTTKGDMAKAMFAVRELIPLLRDIMVNRKEWLKINPESLIPHFLLKPRLLQDDAEILEEMAISQSRNTSVILLSLREKKHASLLAKLEQALRDIPASPVAITVALTRMIRGFIMPDIKPVDPEVSSVEMEQVPDGTLLQPDALKRIAEPKAGTFLVQVQFPGRLVGFKGKNIKSMRPNNACSLKIVQDDPGTRLLRIGVDAVESLVTILSHELFKKHANSYRWIYL